MKKEGKEEKKRRKREKREGKEKKKKGKLKLGKVLKDALNLDDILPPGKEETEETPVEEEDK